MNRKLQALDARKKALFAQCEKILDAAGDGDLDESDQITLDSAKRELKFLNEEMAAEAERSGHNRPLCPDGADTGSLDLAGGFDRMPTARPGDVMYRDADGRVIRALANTERFCAQPASDGEPFVVGRALHSWLTGRREDRGPNLSAMQYGGVDTAGGYMLEPTLSRMVVDLARSASVCMRAGAQTLPMPTNEMNLVRVDSDPTVTWRGEGAAVPASAATFGRITLRSKTLAAIVPVSLELLEDATNAASTIENCLSQAMALAIDQAALGGSGAAAEPLGVRNHPGVGTVAVGGIPTAYDKPSEAVGDILTANYNGDINKLAWILHPRDGVTYDGLLSAAEGQPLRKSPWVQELPQLFTTSIDVTEGAGADSYAIVGDFSQMLIGMRSSGVIFRRVPAGTATDSDGTSYNATSQLLEHLVAHIRVDVALLRPSWFAVLTGIQAS